MRRSMPASHHKHFSRELWCASSVVHDKDAKRRMCQALCTTAHCSSLPRHFSLSEGTFSLSERTEEDEGLDSACEDFRLSDLTYQIWSV